MRNTTLPARDRKCQHDEFCEGELSYYMETPIVLDLYYCNKCYKISEWDDHKLRATDMEAFPNRDKNDEN